MGKAATSLTKSDTTTGPTYMYLDGKVNSHNSRVRILAAWQTEADVVTGAQLRQHGPLIKDNDYLHHGSSNRGIGLLFQNGGGF